VDTGSSLQPLTKSRAQPPLYLVHKAGQVWLDTETVAAGCSYARPSSISRPRNSKGRRHSRPSSTRSPANTSNRIPPSPSWRPDTAYTGVRSIPRSNGSITTTIARMDTADNECVQVRPDASPSGRSCSPATSSTPTPTMMDPARLSALLHLRITTSACTTRKRLDDTATVRRDDNDNQRAN